MSALLISRNEEQDLTLGDFYTEYAGSSGARLGNMVRDVTCPREHWFAGVNAGKDFLTALIEWEIKESAYEVTSGDKISEAVRVATIMEPDAVKSMLRLSPLKQRRNVNALKLWIRQSSYATKGRSRCKSVLSTMAARARKARARRPATRARARAVTVARARNGMVARSTRQAQQNSGAVGGIQEPESECYGTGFVLVVFCSHECTKEPVCRQCHH